jgi:NADH-quinone oxidoreductase subunit C
MTRPVTIDIIKERMKEFGTVEQVRKNRVMIKTMPEKLHYAIRASQAMLECDRLITISTLDNGETFELLYHLIGPHRIIVTLAIDLPRTQPDMLTVSDILPPAGIYERQIHDLFGITFEGHPDLKKIILNEDWPENEHPLRKDWKPGPDTFYGGIKVERM